LPGDGKFADTTVAGIRLRVTDRRNYDPTRTGVTLLAAILRFHRDRIGWIPSHFDRLAGGPVLRERLMAGDQAAAITDSWEVQRRDFEVRRRKVLIY
jgi:uncharacterized protein YbbC (DUF1343 family)